MIEKKDIKLHELKYYHDKSHGFVFKGQEKVSDTSITNLCNMLKDKGVTNSLPEFYCEMNDRLVFVYPKECEFMSGPFYQACQQLSNKFMFLVGGMDWEVDILNAWLKEIKD